MLVVVFLLVFGVLILVQGENSVLVLIHLGELLLYLLILTGRQGWFCVVFATIATRLVLKGEGRVGAVAIITATEIGGNLEEGKVNVGGWEGLVATGGEGGGYG